MRLSKSSRRVGLWAALGLGAAIALPSACLFPDYVFDLPEPSGSGGSTSSTTSTTGSPTSTTSTGTGGMTSSSSAGGGGATSTTVVSSSSTGPTVEDCTNGTDDDGNGKIDCADAACTAAFSCTAPLPAGWEGYFSVYKGDAAGFQGCPLEYPNQMYQGNADLVAPPATCFNAPQTQCTCGTPQGEQCMLSSFRVFDAQCGSGMENCATGNINFPANWNGVACDAVGGVAGGDLTCGPSASATCDTNTGVPCNQSIVVKGTTVGNGSCAPSPLSIMKAPPTWSTLGVACGGPSLDAKGCNGGFQCLPKPPSGFEAGVCISKAGVNMCPNGTVFTKQHVFYGGFTDTRDCTACSCNVPEGSTCTATLNFYATGNCTGAAVTGMVTSVDSCITIQNNVTIFGRKATFSAPSGGSCTPNGGQSIGAAAPNPATATTFCCL